MNENTSGRNSMSVKLILLALGVLMILIAGFMAWWFFTHKTKAKRKKPIALAPKVSVHEMISKSIKVEIPATGLVIPSREATIRARVSGEIIKLHKDLEPGGIFEKDEPIIWLDDKDYKLMVDMKKAQLQKAEAALQLELVQQKIAESQFNSYRNKNAKDRLDMDVILRKPQERSSRADVKIAQAELEEAELDLERTVINSPFNAVVLESEIDIGEQADPQRILANLVDVDSFWVRVSIPLKYLKWIVFPSKQNPEGSSVTVISRMGQRKGKVLRRYTQLETQGRMAQVLVEVMDPLGLKNGKDKTSLLIGEYVEVKIHGRELKDVIPVPRIAYRDNARMWILNPKNKLEIVDVEPVWELRDMVFIEKGLLPQGKIIVSDLGFPVKNMTLKPVIDREPKKVASDTASDNDNNSSKIQ